MQHNYITNVQIFIPFKCKYLLQAFLSFTRLCCFIVLAYLTIRNVSRYTCTLLEFNNNDAIFRRDFASVL